MARATQAIGILPTLSRRPVRPRLLLGQPDAAQLGIGEDGVGDRAVVGGEGFAINQVGMSAPEAPDRLQPFWMFGHDVAGGSPAFRSTSVPATNPCTSKQKYVFSGDKNLAFEQGGLQLKAQCLKILVGGRGLRCVHLEDFVPVRFPRLSRSPWVAGTNAQTLWRPGDAAEMLDKHQFQGENILIGSHSLDRAVVTNLLDRHQNRVAADRGPIAHVWQQPWDSVRLAAHQG